MKRCNNCRYQRRFCSEVPCVFCKDHDRYARKRRLWFAWWIPKLIILALLLGGCCKTTATVDTEKHLMTITRTRFLITEDIGSVSFDATDGSFTIDGYKSDMTRALELVKYFAALSEGE